MTTWSLTPGTSAWDSLSKMMSYAGEIFLAVEERRFPSNTSSRSSYTSGQRLDTFVSSMQTRISSLVGAENWVRTIDLSTYTEYGAEAFDEESSIPVWTMSDLCDAITSGDVSQSSPFRRVSGSSWPSDWTDDTDAAYSWGSAQSGDIIGPWLLYDLQRAIRMLKWKLLSLDFSWLEKREATSYSGGSFWQSNLSAAKSAAESFYGSQTPTTNAGDMYSNLWHRTSGGNSEYGAKLGGARAQPEFTNPSYPSGASCDVECYFSADQMDDITYDSSDWTVTFHVFGLGYVEGFNLCGTASLTSSDDETQDSVCDELGFCYDDSDDPPAWPSGTPDSTDKILAQGFAFGDRHVVAKYDFDYA